MFSGTIIHKPSEQIVPKVRQLSGLSSRSISIRLLRVLNMVDFCIENKAETTAEYDELLMAAKGGCIQSINEVQTRCRVHIRSHVTGYLGKRTRSISPDDVCQEVLYLVFRDVYRCRAETWNDFLQFLVTVSRNKT